MQHPGTNLSAAGTESPAGARTRADEWADSQAQMLLDTWLLTLFALLLGMAVPWFLSGLDIDFAAASWVLLLLGADYAAMTAASHLRERRPLLGRRLLTLLHALGILGMALLWQRCGGLQDPLLLLAFVLPVIGGAALSRWQPYLSALWAVLGAGGVALVQAPELRWYAGGLDALGSRLTALVGAAGLPADAHSAFPGFYAPVGYDLVLLEVFAILLFFCAVTAESIGDVFQKITGHLQAARREAHDSQQLWAALVQQLPQPALLVDVESGTIVLSSAQPAPFWPADEPLGGRALGEAVRCSYPERLAELLGGTGGVVTPVVVHVGQELRIATIRVVHLDYPGPRLALVLLEDTTDAFHLRAALDAEEHALLVISAHGRVVAANKAARALLPEARVGSDASAVLSRSGGLQRWWEPGLTGRRRLHVTLLHRTFLTTSTAMALPGEEQGVFVLSFAPLLASATPGELPVGAAS